MRRLACLLALTVAAVASIAGVAPGDRAQTPPDRICFPVDPAVTVSWTDTFGAPRSGHTHEGQDIMGPKMTRLMSAVDGRVLQVVFQNDKGNRVVVQGDDGWFYVYLHVNNDTPGTDNGAATYDQAFAPGLIQGQRVTRGQHIAYLGDSGNAESAGSHLHFETRTPLPPGTTVQPWSWSSATAVNPATALREAEACDRWTPFLTVEELVTRQYRDFYGRDPDGGGLTHWTGQLDANRLTAHQFVGQLLAAPEFAERISPVARLYRAFFGRTPDSAGLDYWVAEYTRGVSLGTIAQVFADSPEFGSTYGSLDNGAFVDLVYGNVLGRAPDAGGRAYWVGHLDQGMARGSMMVQFSESPEYKALTAQWVKIVLVYASMLDRAPDPGGLDYWMTQDPVVLVSAFWGSDEYRQRVAALRASGG
jgi:Domain of unknown function (DUF4214)/Peptidase family M23